MSVLLLHKNAPPPERSPFQNQTPIRRTFAQPMDAPKLGTYSVNGVDTSYVEIIKQPTPITDGTYKNFFFKIKREDLTDVSIYGGNKVRNLEFILARALLANYKAVATPIPLGSNFSAAFVGHAKNAGLLPILNQVLLAKHPQITDHYDFCRSMQPKMTTREGVFKFAQQGFDLAGAAIFDSAMIVPPGGSNVLGALGHFRAFEELVLAVHQGRAHMPKLIFVGAGTGGTTAGLLAAMTYFGVETKLIAVRCAEPMICNRRRFIKLAQDTLKYIGSDKVVDPSALELIESPGNIRYGLPLNEFDQIFDDFYAENHLELDRTYTAKVVHAMASYLRSHHLGRLAAHRHEILYWHTFSALASNELHRKKTSHS